MSAQRRVEAEGKPQVQWVRKRDGDLVPFDLAQLARSLALAAEQLGLPLEREAADELAAMAAFFLAAQLAQPTASSDEISEWVIKALREPGHDALADAYERYRQLKHQCSRSLLVCDRLAPGLSDRVGEPWDKRRLIRTLRRRLGLTARQARDVAGLVERRVVRGGFERLSRELLRELVNNELAAAGINRRLGTDRHVRLPADWIRQQLAANVEQESAGRTVLGAVLSEFALQEVVSPDVAEAVGARLLQLPGLAAPTSLAATALDCCRVVRESASATDAIGRLGHLLADAARSTSMLLAVDRIEPCLSLCSDGQRSAAELAEWFWQELLRRVRPVPVWCVLNLYGGFPRDWSGQAGLGPLFVRQPSSEDCRLAAQISDELLGRFLRDAADWPRLRLDWHWQAALPSSSRIARRAVQLAVQGHAVAVTFERGAVPLAEAMCRRGELTRPVLCFAGISLPQLWRQAGRPPSLTALEEPLVEAVRLTVRAAVQQREFMRQVAAGPADRLLDRAVLAMYPIGLDWLISELAGESFCVEPAGLPLAVSTVELLIQACRQESRHFGLQCVLDAPPACVGPGSAILWAGTLPGQAGQMPAGPQPVGQGRGAGETLPGLQPIDCKQGPRSQISAVAPLHRVAEAGTLICYHWEQALGTPESAISLLNWAAEQTALVRLRLAPPRSEVAQATVQWPEE